MKSKLFYTPFNVNIFLNFLRLWLKRVYCYIYRIPNTIATLRCMLRSLELYAINRTLKEEISLLVDRKSLIFSVIYSVLQIIGGSVTVYWISSNLQCFIDSIKLHYCHLLEIKQKALLRHSLQNPLVTRESLMGDMHGFCYQLKSAPPIISLEKLTLLY